MGLQLRGGAGQVVRYSSTHFVLWLGLNKKKNLGLDDEDNTVGSVIDLRNITLPESQALILQCSS